MLEREHVGGFYLDVMQGAALPCYWPGHGHAAAGADVATTGMHELVATIHRKVKSKNQKEKTKLLLLLRLSWIL